MLGLGLGGLEQLVRVGVRVRAARVRVRSPNPNPHPHPAPDPHQVAMSNAQQIELKKTAGDYEKEDDRRIAAYCRDRER